MGAHVGAKMTQVAPRWEKLGLSWRSNLASFAPREEQHQEQLHQQVQPKQQT